MFIFTVGFKWRSKPELQTYAHLNFIAIVGAYGSIGLAARSHNMNNICLQSASSCGILVCAWQMLYKYINLHEMKQNTLESFLLKITTLYIPYILFSLDQWHILVLAYRYVSITLNLFNCVKWNIKYCVTWNAKYDWNLPIKNYNIILSSTHHVFYWSIIKKISSSSTRRRCAMFPVDICVVKLGTFSRLWGLEVVLVLTITVPNNTWGTYTLLYGDLIAHRKIYKIEQMKTSGWLPFSITLY